MKSFLLTILLASQVFAATYTEVVEYIPTADPKGYCNILKRTTVLRDGVEISTQNHRDNLDVDSDLSKFDSRVQAICRANFTPEVVKRFRDNKEKAEKALPVGK